jgi:hypothetical protein
MIKSQVNQGGRKELYYFRDQQVRRVPAREILTKILPAVKRTMFIHGLSSMRYG